MKILERLYRSPIGRLMSIVAHQYGKLSRPIMIYGYKDPATRIFQKYTRISSSAVIMNEDRLSMADHVWVWHYSILDATAGLTIEEGCQIGAWVGIFTHGSQNSIRLLGRQYVNIPYTERKGYSHSPVKIGAYTFIGAGAIVLPGVSIGKGSLLGAGTLVSNDIPEYSIVAGVPGKVRGSTMDLDKEFFDDPDIVNTYFDQSIFNK